MPELTWQRQYLGRPVPDPNWRGRLLEADMQFCYEYLDFGFKSPVIMDFSKFGMTLARTMNRAGHNILIRFTQDEYSTLEWAFGKYIRAFKHNSLPRNL